jgi:homoserine dehydrogenase
MNSYNVALIGCGTVGGGVAELLLQHADRVAARAGRPVVLKRVVVRDASKIRDAHIPKNLLTSDLRTVLDDPTIDCAIEVVGGVDWAKKAVLDLLAAGKEVVTANKALLAMHGAEVFDAGRRHEKAIAFEASVAGGIPIIGALMQGLAANQIESIQGILNGTCNFILTAMTEQGRDYGAVLAEAQKLGYAEADPTMDVDGTDAAHKLAILAQLAFGLAVPLDKIPRRGIDKIDAADIRYAHELGYTIKLLAEAWFDSKAGTLALHVAPVMLRSQSPLALVRDAYNAIFVHGDAVGSTLYYGRGAGRMPTASAVVADVIDMAVGRAQQTFRSLKLWSGESKHLSLRPTGTVPSRFYLRLLVEDRPGALAEITRTLADHHISISSVIQHEAIDGAKNIVPLIILTHSVPTGNFTAMLAEFDRLKCVTAKSVHYPVGD